MKDMLFSKHRVEALSDGVFAIAMTLLILDIKVPLDKVPGQLGVALLHEGPEWVSFLVTFTLASSFWTLQHRVFDQLEKIDRTNLSLTFVFLGFVSVLPFSTSLWGHHIKEPLAFVVYFFNQFALAMVLLVKVKLAERKGHLKLGPESDRLRLRLYGMCLAMGTGTATSGFVPIRFAAFPFMGVAVAVRLLRRLQERRIAKTG